MDEIERSTGFQRVGQPGIIRQAGSPPTPQPRWLCYSKSSCAFSGVISAKRTPTPMRRTGFPVRANASASSERKSSNAGWSPARSAVVRVKSLNFNFTKIFVIARVDSFCARSAIKSWKSSSSLSSHCSSVVRSIVNVSSVLSDLRGRSGSTGR